MIVRVHFERVQLDRGVFEIEADSPEEAKRALKKFAREDRIVALPIEWERVNQRVDVIGATEAN